MEPSMYQQAIINSVRNDRNNILIDAKAGSGKTSTLMLISEELSKQNKKSLFLAFNKTIVTELKSRLAGNTNIEVRTINSLGYSFICSYLYKKYGRDGYYVASVSESKNTSFFVKQFIMDNLLDDIRESREDIRDDEKLFKGLINSLANEAIYIVDFIRFNFINHKDKEAVKNFIVYRINEQRIKGLLDEDNGIKIDSIVLLVETVIDNMISKFLNPLYNEQTGKYDFDIEFKDEVFFPLYFNMKVPYSLTQYLDYILVDEDQDLSIIQQLLVKKLDNYKSTRYIFVGDEKQAIYGFSGADTSSVDNIRNNFNVKELPLNICYRCPEKVVKLAQYLVPDIEWNKKRLDRGNLTIIDRDHIDKYIQNGDLILSRKNKILLELFIEEVLHKRRKMKFLNGKLVYSIINDVINSITEYIKRYNKCTNIEKDVVQFLDKENISYVKKERSPKQVTIVQKFVKDLLVNKKQEDKYITKKNFNLKYLLMCMNEYKENGSYNYVTDDRFEKQYEDDGQLVDYYNVIQDFISEYVNIKYGNNLKYYLEHNIKILENIKVDEFTDYFENFLTASNYEEENCPKLSTIHQMKGSEAERVFILDYPDFPYNFGKSMSNDDRQQERNLQYVALTRAKSDLYLVLISETKETYRSIDVIVELNNKLVEDLSNKYNNDITVRIEKNNEVTVNEVNKTDLENSLEEEINESKYEISFNSKNKQRYGTITDVNFIEDNT